jgi:hypothetical protein
LSFAKRAASTSLLTPTFVLSHRSPALAAPGHERLTPPAAERRARSDRIKQEDVQSPAALLER